MDIIYLDDFPSQEYTVQIDGVAYEMVFMYNQIADRWSFTIGIDGEACPLLAGKFIEPQIDLLHGLPGTQMLLVLDRPGITTTGLNWYDRMTKVLGDNIPATMLIMGTVDEFNSLFTEQQAITC